MTSFDISKDKHQLENLKRKESPWNTGRIIACISIMLGAIVVTWDEWHDIYRIAKVDEEASHIFLVPVIIVWMIVVRKDYLGKCRVKPSITGPILIVIGWILLVYGFNHAVQAARHTGAILTVVGALVTITGLDFVRKFWPAFAVLVFLVPVPGLLRLQISNPLQTWTATLAQFFSIIFGMDVERSGNVLSYNNVDVAVAEACNGMRMIFALVLVSFAFAFGTHLQTWVRILIIALSPVIAIICNVIRLIPTVYVYGQYSESTAELFHDYSGWVMLLVALGMLTGFVRLLAWLKLSVFPQKTRHKYIPSHKFNR